MNAESHEDAMVRAAVERFYRALEALLTGRGTELMKEAWHHSERATAVHPMGDWSRGWDEILATWSVVARAGAPESAGSHIRDLEVRVYGDVAYSICVFVAAPRFSGATVNCTNVLVFADGVWRVVHHHADKSREIERGHLEAATDPK